MEDLILKCANSGLELVALFFLIRTLPVLNELSRSIDKLSDKFDLLDRRIGNIEQQLGRRNFNEQSHYSRN